MSSRKIWDIYMKSYDKLLLSLTSYSELLEDICRHALRQTAGMKKSVIHILEAGCGTGNILKRLDQLREELPDRQLRLTGIDRSDSALAAAAGKGIKGCRLFQGDLSRPGLGMTEGLYKDITNSPYDLIVINNVLFALPDKEVFLREMKQQLSPEGVLILSEPHDRASLSAILRNERSRLGFRGIFRLLFTKAFLWHLGKVVFINLLFFPKSVSVSAEKQKAFMARSGFTLIDEQHGAYGGNNMILVFRK